MELNPRLSDTAVHEFSNSHLNAGSHDCGQWSWTAEALMCGRESVCVCVAGFVSVCETSQLFSLNVGAPHTTSATVWLPRRCFECFCPCFVFHSSSVCLAV